MLSLSKLKLSIFPNGLASFLIDNKSVTKTAAYTIVTTDDSGKSFVSTLDGMVYTLPAIAVGNTITFVNMAGDGLAALSVSPNANDGVTYAGSSTDNKDLVLAKATSRKGDFVTLASLNGTVAWQVVAVRGKWSKQA